MAGAPRIFEKVLRPVTLTSRGAGGPEGEALRLGVRGRCGRGAALRRRAAAAAARCWRCSSRVADRLVFAQDPRRFGGRIRFFVSGSAALSRDVARVVRRRRPAVLEGYGLTETSAATFVNRPGPNRVGTVGPPLPGTEVGSPTTARSWSAGPGVMRGYHNLPEDDRGGADADGWLHTGDIGELTTTAYLRITDRKKDLIKTSGGKYVAPQKIEGRSSRPCAPTLARSSCTARAASSSRP